VHGGGATDHAYVIHRRVLQPLQRPEYDLTRFVADVGRIMAQTSDDREKLAQLHPLIKTVVADPSWLRVR